MHIPDGFLTVQAWLPAWLLSLFGLRYSIIRGSRMLKDKMIPLMGVMAAFIFAAQMLNFPVIGGTSGHLLGGVLASVLLGPYAGAIVVALVLIVQCLIFQDGGVTTLGANILNMAFVGSIGGYLVYRGIRGLLQGSKGIIIGAGIAAWLSVVAAASFCALELAFSGTVPLQITLPAMAGMYTIIGLGEAAITCSVVSFVLKVRPDLVYKRETGHL